MRRRFRRHYPRVRASRCYSDDSISIADFLFYNRQQKIIDSAIILEIEAQILADHNKIIYWTNEDFLNAGAGFKFTYRESNDQEGILESVEITMLEHNRRIRQDLSVSQYCQSQAHTGNCFFSFQLSEEQANLVNDLLRDKFYEEKIVFFSAWEDFVTYAIVTPEFLDNIDSSDYSFEEFVGKCKLLFPTLECKEASYERLRRGGSFTEVEVYHIVKVFEERRNDMNYRVAITADIDTYGQKHVLKVIPESSKFYNYVDEGRVYFAYLVNKEPRHFFFDLQVVEYHNKQVVIDLDLIDLMRKTIHQIMPETQYLIPPLSTGSTTKELSGA